MQAHISQSVSGKWQNNLRRSGWAQRQEITDEELSCSIHVRPHSRIRRRNGLCAAEQSNDEPIGRHDARSGQPEPVNASPFHSGGNMMPYYNGQMGDPNMMNRGDWHDHMRGSGMMMGA